MGEEESKNIDMGTLGSSFEAVAIVVIDIVVGTLAYGETNSGDEEVIMSTNSRRKICLFTIMSNIHSRYEQSFVVKSHPGRRKPEDGEDRGTSSLSRGEVRRDVPKQPSTQETCVLHSSLILSSLIVLLTSLRGPTEEAVMFQALGN
ncbi:hypothetical protein ACFE04_002302 [Oxalis oulophora]